jgi:outer membrane protein assembly factor BamB
MHAKCQIGFNMFISRVAALVLVVCGLCDCGGTMVPDSAPAGADSRAGLPAPAAALAKLPVRGAAEALLELRGSDFALGQNAIPVSTDALLAPGWTSNASPFADVAYAVYRFNLQGFTGPQTLQVTWSAAPQDSQLFWIGFSDWEIDRWDWRASNASGMIHLGDKGYAPYTDSGKGDVLIAVAVLGDVSVRLTKVQVGVSAQGDWWMEGHDPQHTRRSSFSGARTNHLKWAYDTGDLVRTPPVIGADGTIYVSTFRSADNGPSNVFAINPDGMLKWSFTTAGRVDTSAALGADGTVYAGCVDNRLYAISPDGTLEWSFATGGKAGAPAIGADGAVYVGSNDNSIYALNPDGSLKWSFPTGGLVTSPAIGVDGTVYAGSWDNKLYALNLDGTLKWSYEAGNRMMTSAAIGVDGAVYVGSSDGNIYAINADGALKWAYAGDTARSPGIGADGTIYIERGLSGLDAINPDGSLKWNYTTSFQMNTAPAIGADGTVYVMSYDGSQSGGGPNSRFLAINADGTLLWSYMTHKQMTSAAIGPDGTVYVGSEDHKLYAFGP